MVIKTPLLRDLSLFISPLSYLVRFVNSDGFFLSQMPRSTHEHGQENVVHQMIDEWPIERLAPGKTLHE